MSFPTIVIIFISIFGQAFAGLPILLSDTAMVAMDLANENVPAPLPSLAEGGSVISSPLSSSQGESIGLWLDLDDYYRLLDKADRVTSTPSPANMSPTTAYIQKLISNCVWLITISLVVLVLWSNSHLQQEAQISKAKIADLEPKAARYNDAERKAATAEARLRASRGDIDVQMRSQVKATLLRQHNEEIAKIQAEHETMVANLRYRLKSSVNATTKAENGAVNAHQTVLEERDFEISRLKDHIASEIREKIETNSELAQLEKRLDASRSSMKNKSEQHRSQESYLQKIQGRLTVAKNELAVEKQNSEEERNARFALENKNEALTATLSDLSGRYTTLSTSILSFLDAIVPHFSSYNTSAKDTKALVTHLASAQRSCQLINHIMSPTVSHSTPSQTFNEIIQKCQELFQENATIKQANEQFLQETDRVLQQIQRVAEENAQLKHAAETAEAKRADAIKLWCDVSQMLREADRRATEASIRNEGLVKAKEGKDKAYDQLVEGYKALDKRHKHLALLAKKLANQEAREPEQGQAESSAQGQARQQGQGQAQGGA